MIEQLAMLLLLSDEGATSLPRHGDVISAEERPVAQEHPTDPLFDGKHVATDDPAFMLAAIESSRQGVVDADSVAQKFRKPGVRDAAQRIRHQNEVTAKKLESIATKKGWRLPDDNPQRASTLPVAGETRTAANFIVGQIAAHEATIAQFRAQLGGKGDAEVKRALRDALPGYQENLVLLLSLDF